MPQGLKLRSKPQEKPFQIVLVEPEIPPNTGAVARTCAATGSSLHLVGKLGFSIDEKSVKRAGLDYWDLLKVQQHTDFDQFLQAQTSTPQLYFFSGQSNKSYLAADFKPGDALIFGKESVGLDPQLLKAYPENVWAIPMPGFVRSLNLSNAVAVVLYEALRKNGGLDDLFLK